MKQIVLATRNYDKVREFRELLRDIPVQLLSYDDFPNFPETAVIEDGNSFAQNALKKARAVCAITGKIALADDSGLEVDALDGAPGIYSSRYAGVEGDARRNIARLLKELEALPWEQRSAQFRCVIALVTPSGKEHVVEGICRGRITEAARGNGGFGYDPVFLDENSGLTFAEMGAELKNKISHRGRAMQKLKKILPEFLL